MDIDKFITKLKGIDNISLLTEENFNEIKENIKEKIKKPQS